MFDQIKIIDYRNACYQGFLLDGAFDRIGAILTEDFLFCLANWKMGVLSGPCFTIFPNEKIFYGDFNNNKPDGICCYQMGKQCQFYCFYDNGKMKKICLAVFPYLGCVLQIELDEKQNIIRSTQNYYDTEQPKQKWQIISKISGVKVPEYIKSINKYMNQSFIGKYKIIEDVIGEEYFFGFRGEGLGVKFYRKYFQIASIGYYDKDKVLKYLGKRIINQDKKVKEEGIYQKPQTLTRYLQRPPILRKTYRNFFRQSINFQNKFIQLPILQNLQKQLNKLKEKVKDGTTQKIAQQLIQHLDQNNNILPDNINNTSNRTQPINISSNNRTQLNETPRDRSYLNKPKVAEQVTLHDLKLQLNRSISNKKSVGKSPYKNYNPAPAELKYTSKTNTNKKTEIQPYKDRQTPNRNDRNPIIQDDYKEYYQEPKRYQPKIRYPIEEDLRPMNKVASKSPIRTENKPIKYHYMEDSNPQIQQSRRTNYPGGIYSNNNIKSPAQNYSSNRRNYHNIDRLDKFEKIYDNLQEQKNNNKYNQPLNRQYQLNKGNGYKYIEQDSLDKKMGLNMTNRTVQQPKNRSRSPLYTEQDYQRDQREKYNYYNDKKYLPDKKYGYFDKNR